jgi:hypothetical protein
MGGPTTFFTVSDAAFFPATVALINSVRLMGSTDEVCVADAGLRSDQIERLRTHARVVQVGSAVPRNPQLLKPFASRLQPAGTVIVIDSDMILTGPVDDVVAMTEQGRICAYADPERDRWFLEWERLFDLPGPPRRQPYVSTNFVAFSTSSWPHLLEAWWEACGRVPPERTLLGGAANEDPLAQSDQDALNAVLMSRVPPEALTILPPDERPVPLRGRARVRDPRRLRVAVGDRPVRLLHRGGRWKPWEARSWWHARLDAYTRLFPRVTTGPDVALRLSPRELPMWMRSGSAGRMAMGGLDVLNTFTWTGVRAIRAAASRVRAARAR